MWYSLSWGFAFSARFIAVDAKLHFGLSFSALHHLARYMNSKLEDTSHSHCFDWSRNSKPVAVWESNHFLSALFFPCSLPPWTSRHFLTLKISPSSSHRVKIPGPLEPEDTRTSISPVYSSVLFSLQKTEERQSRKNFLATQLTFWQRRIFPKKFRTS